VTACNGSMAQEREESKWASLLQPIKQLEKNWDIDIASELTDYLEELAGLTFEVNGQANLNFAEAALVVHSSSCTYGKKVDYLMKLTLAALESAKAKQQENGSARKKRVRNCAAASRQTTAVRAPMLRPRESA
jgi:Condensin II complex subunit CAP-H2 or CNDH2, N-terminal